MEHLQYWQWTHKYIEVLNFQWTALEINDQMDDIRSRHKRLRRRAWKTPWDPRTASIRTSYDQIVQHRISEHRNYGRGYRRTTKMGN